MRNLNICSYQWISILIAYVISIIPLPEPLVWCRPQFLVMVMVFWVMKSNVSGLLWIAWFSGLGLDLLTGSLLGQHALSLSLLIYTCIKLRPYLHLYRRWQHGLLMLLLSLFYVSVQVWVLGHFQQNFVSALFWFSSLLTSIIWLFIYPYLPTLQKAAGSHYLNMGV